METNKLRIIITSALILITIISGIWLSRLGRPLNTAVFTVHKLAPLVAAVLMVIIVYSLQKNITIDNNELILIIITGLVFLVALVSGAFLSFDKFVIFVILTLHKVMPFLVVISGILTIYILIKKN